MSKQSAEARLALLAERAEQDRDEMLDFITHYGETDLVCYHSPDEALGRAQRAAFLPILDWARQQHGLNFATTESLTAVAQDKKTLDALRTLFAQADDRELAALTLLTPSLGSAILTLAIWKGRIDVQQAIEASLLDETHQAQKWGQDEEAKAAWAIKEKDIRAGALFLTHK